MLTGGFGKDYLNGAKGDDVLDGGAGNDRIYLGGGDDVATGGTGSDRFVFRANDLDGGQDFITDFRRSGTEKDLIDVRKLDLLDGLSIDQWLSSNVTLGNDGTVTADLGGCDLTFQSRGANEGDAFYQEICDGFLF